MHSFGYRANALLTFAVMVLALMCAMATLSDNFHSSSPSAHVKVLEVTKFRKTRVRGGDDEIHMTLNITANLQSLFTWNTKQVFLFLAAEYETPKNSVNQISLWDTIIQSKEEAKFSIRTTKLKYRFTDQGANFRGKEYNMTLHWHIMPKTGKMLVDKLVLTGFRMPQEYR